MIAAPPRARGASVSIVVPVCNSAQSLGPLIARIETALASLDSLAAFEVVLVDDGSRDASWGTVEEMARAHAFVRGIRLMRNYGQHNALLCGIRAAKHDVVVTIDDDLQHPPEEIPRLLAALTDDLDVVYGTPKGVGHGLWRDLASRVTKLALQSAMGAKTAVNSSAFRAFRTSLRDAFVDYRSPQVSIDILLTWATARFSAIPVEHDARRHGTSNYTFRKLLTHALNMLTGFTTLPLQLASWIGFALTAFGALVLLAVVARYLIAGSSVPGFPFLASIVALFSGAQLFALGIIGEYLARVHDRSMARPAYAIRTRTQDAGAGAGETDTRAQP